MTLLRDRCSSRGKPSKLRAVAALALVITTLVAFAAPVGAWTASNLTIVGVSGDSIYNYDFGSQNPSSTNVDWPITMVFHNNAEVDKVKNIYWGAATASTMYARFNDDGSYIWDSDKGTKTGSCFGTARHMRLYADESGDQNYNVAWGYYVLGTTHYDKEECEEWNDKFGWSEEVEEYMVNHASGQGYGVNHDAFNFQNNEPYRQEGAEHFWENNQYASKVDVWP